LDEQPTKFNLQCAGNVANTDLYKEVALQQIRFTDEHIEGVLFNSGVQEVTIPQLLISYYDNEKELLWVDHKFLTEGVRIQRKQFFDYKTMNLSKIDLINTSLEFCFVNGLPNSEIAKKIIPVRDKNHGKNQLQGYEGDGFSFLKFEINSYIGNPK
jgi:hypothetical protein